MPESPRSATPYYPGIPAIPPRSAPVDASGARLTAEDVQQYLATHQLLPTPSGTPPVVLSIQFLSNADARRLLKVNVTIPDENPVCHVVVQGPILMWKSYDHQPPTASPKGTLVFDATTGNLLLRGLRSD